VGISILSLVLDAENSQIDSKLTLWWYDAQGCIKTTPIDLIEQLPLFVTMIMIFQRFDDRMLGLPEGAIDVVSEGVLVLDRPLFVLAGRRTFTGRVEEHPINSSARGPSGRVTRFTALHPPVLDNSPALSSPGIFFKSAWPENTHRKEPALIAEALKRANAYFPENHVSSVIDHLPTVIASEELKHTSTSIIRHLLGLSTEGARTQVWMASETLQPIIKVNVAMFKKYYWELVRCTCFC